jgi:uncharacterized protein
MSLKNQIDGDIKNAMLARDKDKLRALRAIKSLILLAETEKGVSESLSEEVELKLLTKAAKQRKDSFELFKAQGRPDLATIEEDELIVINTYLPKQLTEAEIKEELTKIISQIGAKGPQDMGKVMGAATKALAGKAEGKTISDLVKSLLS